MHQLVLLLDFVHHFLGDLVHLDSLGGQLVRLLVALTVLSRYDSRPDVFLIHVGRDPFDPECPRGRSSIALIALRRRSVCLPCGTSLPSASAIMLRTQALLSITRNTSCVVLSNTFTAA
eukprot:16450352-Heterocapsa_arctica.AAC.1